MFGRRARRAFHSSGTRWCTRDDALLPIITAIGLQAGSVMGWACWWRRSSPGQAQFGGPKWLRNIDLCLRRRGSTPYCGHHNLGVGIEPTPDQHSLVMTVGYAPSAIPALAPFLFRHAFFLSPPPRARTRRATRALKTAWTTTGGGSSWPQAWRCCGISAWNSAAMPRVASLRRTEIPARTSRKHPLLLMNVSTLLRRQSCTRSANLALKRSWTSEGADASK